MKDELQRYRLSPETLRRVDLLFTPQARDEVIRMLGEECGRSLPGAGSWDEFHLERLQIAALKLSDGNLRQLRDAIELAKQDWRDLLVAAGFDSNPNLHRDWLPDGNENAHNSQETQAVDADAEQRKRDSFGCVMYFVAFFVLFVNAFAMLVTLLRRSWWIG